MQDDASSSDLFSPKHATAAGTDSLCTDEADVAFIKVAFSMQLLLKVTGHLASADLGGWILLQQD